MTWDRSNLAEVPCRFRFAMPKDATAISELYTHTYTPPGGGVAGDHYPFPQIMQDDQVIEMINGGTIIWVVAEGFDGTIVGSAAAVRNIGGPEDQIAEIFGVAVNQSCRRQGIGSGLLQKLRTELESFAEFVLCEARTAEAGGWKAARNAGLRPVGFEPYAHAMPIGFESMVPTACWNWGRWRPPHKMHLQNTEASMRLANAVCSHNPSDQLLRRTSTERIQQIREQTRSGNFMGEVSVRRDDGAGVASFSSAGGAFARQFCVVELCPLQGTEAHSRRFDHAYYVASRSGKDIAAARVFYDLTDARARILCLRGMAEVEPQLLEGIVKSLLEACENKPLVIVVCVRVNTPEIQLLLEALDFVPTAYFPRMVSTPTGLTDVIQYTRLVRRSWPGSISSVTALNWPDARRVIDEVLLLQDKVT